MLLLIYDITNVRMIFDVNAQNHSAAFIFDQLVFRILTKFLVKKKWATERSKNKNETAKTHKKNLFLKYRAQTD